MRFKDARVGEHFLYRMYHDYMFWWRDIRHEDNSILFLWDHFKSTSDPSLIALGTGSGCLSAHIGSPAR